MRETVASASLARQVRRLGKDTLGQQQCSIAAVPGTLQEQLGKKRTTILHKERQELSIPVAAPLSRGAWLGVRREVIVEPGCGP